MGLKLGTLRRGPLLAALRRRPRLAALPRGTRRVLVALLLLAAAAAFDGARTWRLERWNGQIAAGEGFEYWLLKFDGVAGNKDKELEDPKGYGAIEYAYLRARGISTPGWIGLSLIDCVLVCPRHPEARPLLDFFLLPPQPGSDEVAPEQ